MNVSVGMLGDAGRGCCHVTERERERDPLYVISLKLSFRVAKWTAVGYTHRGRVHSYQYF